MVSYCIGNSSI